MITPEQLADLSVSLANHLIGELTKLGVDLENPQDGDPGYMLVVYRPVQDNHQITLVTSEPDEEAVADICGIVRRKVLLDVMAKVRAIQKVIDESAGGGGGPT